MKIYLAGKIRKFNDWREGIVYWKSRALAPDARGWPILQGAIFGEHDYTGPFHIEDSRDHRCYGGNASHGVGADHEWDEDHYPDVPNRDCILQLCKSAILASDAVFAWIDDSGAYGTCAEIGFAAAHGKPVCVSTSYEFHENKKAESAEYWFVESFGMNSGSGCYGSPEQPLKIFLESLQPKTFVYFIEAVGLEKIKIGYSADPDSRLSTLQTGSAAELRLLGRIRGTKDTEAQLHRKFAGLRMAGEWFHGTQEIRQHIAQLCQGGA